MAKMTQKKYDELLAELKWRKTVERDRISRDIKTASDMGDLSENAEYSSAKDAQRNNESQIIEIDYMLSHAEIIDESDIDLSVVSLCTTVKVYDVEFDEEVDYEIVPALDADIMNNKISEESPIAKALLGRKVGETVVAKAPGGDMEFKILSIAR